MPTVFIEDTFNTGGTWNSSAGTPTIVSSPAPPSATRALQTNAIGEYVFWTIPALGYTRLVLGVWVQIPAAPAAAASRLMKIDAGLSEGWTYLLSPAARPYIQADGTPSITQTNFANDLVLNTWQWVQIMFDLSANPWELRGKIGSEVVSNTGAAAASNFNDVGSKILLGNTTGGEALTYYFGHMKAGVAIDDNDWFAEPTLSAPLPSSVPVSSRGVSW